MIWLNFHRALVMFPPIRRFNHRLAFYKQAEEPFIEASNPHDDKQDWLKNQNKPLGPIELV